MNDDGGYVFEVEIERERESASKLDQYFSTG